MKLRVPHWVIVGLGLAVLLDQWLLTNIQNGTLALPPWVVGFATLALSVLGLFSSNVVDEARLAKAKAMAATAASSLIVWTLCLGMLALAGCSSPAWQQLVNDVEQGLENGSTLATLEGIVVSLFPQFANQAAATDAVLQALVDFLEALGVLSPKAQANVQAVRAELKAKRPASPQAEAPLPEDAQRLVAELHAARRLEDLSPRTRLLVARANRAVRE